MSSIHSSIRMACQNLVSTSVSCHSILSYFPCFLSRPSPSFFSRRHAFSSLRAFTPPGARLLSSSLLLDTKLHYSYPHKPLSEITLSPRVTKTVEYIFPDPIPEFAEAETIKFRAHLLERLSKKDIFDDSLEEIVCICTEILSNFLHTEYGGPGTLLVVPFIDMADTINERGLPGGPQAARAAVVWAQKHIDKDWKDWTGDPNL